MRRTNFGLATLVLILLAAGCSTNRATGQRQLSLYSAQQEVALGMQADQQFQKEFRPYPDEDLQRYVTEVGQKLASASERPELPWKFRLVDDPSVNAFALPGGFVYITRGILGYLNSEAELASVLGHEIGHVTARHSVEQMSKQQLAGIGLAVAMIASPELRQYGDLAQAGLGLMFLKFGRDHERQADQLGIRYMTRGQYDAREAPDMFRTLDRISEREGTRLPEWQSTHPDPGNRAATLEKIAAAIPEGQRGSVIAEEAFLRRLDGVMFGENPREGYVIASRFYHPDLQFQLDFPRGWKIVNQKAAVGALSPNQDAIIVFTAVPERSPRDAAAAFFSQQGVQQGSIWYDTLTFRALSQDGTTEAARGLVDFVQHGGNVYRLLAYTKPQTFDQAAQTMLSSVKSFRTLTDRRYIDVDPKKIEIVKLPRSMTIEEFAERYPSTIDAQTLALINGVAAGDRLEAGRLAKRVLGGRLPG